AVPGVQRVHRLPDDIGAGVNGQRLQVRVVHVERGASDPGPAHHRGHPDLLQRTLGALLPESLPQSRTGAGRPRVLGRHRGHLATSTAARARAPGSAWANRIRRLAVAAPNTPAITTHTRKKTRTRNPVGSPAIRPHTRPAARKPLYRPWLAAN